MDLTAVRCLVNSVSRFIHLVTCSTMKTMPVQNDYVHLSRLLKHLKPLLDNVVDGKIPSDEILCKECEELDIAVNEAREFLEKWSPKMSKILCVVQSELLFQNIESASFKISKILSRSSQSACTKSRCDFQHFMQKYQHLKLEKVSLSHHVKEALQRQTERKIPSPEYLLPIIQSLNLASNLELLNELIALEKERMKAEDHKLEGNLEEVNHIIGLTSHIRDTMVKLENFKSIDGFKIPSYFLCPLSLELMLDPVIVASGQTYERTSIQKWLDHGLSICPKTRQKLSHTNLIPNYTVKDLIRSWCEEKKVKLPECHSIASITSESENLNYVDKVQYNSQGGNSNLKSSIEFRQDSEKKVDGSDGFCEEEFHACQVREAEKSDHSSTHSYVHSRSESTSSAVSSVDYLLSASPDLSRISSNHDNMSDRSDIVSDCSSSVLRENPECSPSLTGRHYHNFKTKAEVAVNGNHNPSRSLSLLSESRCNDLTSTSHVEKLIKDLKSQSSELQTAAAAELRFLAKHNMENRYIIGNSGAIAPLISLLHSDVKPTQEHAVTALLNLSINEKIKALIAEGGAVEPLIHVLRTGNAGAKENAAACLFSLSVLEEYRTKIGCSAAVKALVDLLGSGTVRGKKDAATALFNLSILHENKARIIQAGAVTYLVELLDPEREMVDKAVALLANLSTITEGCSAIAREGGIPYLVEIVEIGTQRGKENAASILLQLCINSSQYCRLVLQEGAVPPLVALSQSGTPRAKEKAQQLLSHFRAQREGATGRGKS
ncbi:hypothetical protein ACH5RR_020296 [Cinchona calisaya]|uniref:RING-type E3 ubiquitin transferase n=1 Tax=Cinchona calisaya TaxID=153742 RepID=A0ABD2ZE02_9GENT